MLETLETRYARQMILKEIGRSGQERLGNSRVLIVGMGGLGSPASLYLAAAGVGCLGIIDADVVDRSNLQRQILYATQDAGQSKVQQAKARLEALNPHVKVLSYSERLTAANALNLVQEYDLILDGTDNFSAKFLLNDVCVKLGKPLVYGSILRWEGQLAVFWAQHGPCYRCLYPSPPEQHVPNCAEAGVIGALAGVVGSLQALEAIKVLVAGPPPYTDHLSPLLGQLWIVRASTMETQSLRLKRNPHCPVCSQLSDHIVLTDLDPPSCELSGAGETFMEFTAEEMAAKDRWKDFQWLDVRESHEWALGRLPGAHHWPLSAMLRGEWPQMTQDRRPLVLYCQGGVRSLRALQLLKHQGLEVHGHLRDGFRAWLGPVEQALH
jgi:thiazole biosynthesis adenylyltransferase ThiF